MLPGIRCIPSSSVACFFLEYTRIGRILDHVHTIRQYLGLPVIDHLASLVLIGLSVCKRPMKLHGMKSLPENMEHSCLHLFLLSFSTDICSQIEFFIWNKHLFHINNCPKRKEKRKLISSLPRFLLLSRIIDTRKWKRVIWRRQGIKISSTLKIIDYLFSWKYY